MSDQPSATPLPDALRGYFWDYDPDRLSWEGSRHTIVRRLLESGGLDAVQWLRARMTDDELRDFIARRQGRGMEPRRLRFWALVLDLPREQVDEWVRVARATPWNQRTH